MSQNQKNQRKNSQENTQTNDYTNKLKDDLKIKDDTIEKLNKKIKQLETDSN